MTAAAETFTVKLRRVTATHRQLDPVLCLLASDWLFALPLQLLIGQKVDPFNSVKLIIQTLNDMKNKKVFIPFKFLKH